MIGGGEVTRAARETLIRRQMAFAWRLNRFLRKLPPGKEIDGLLDNQERASIEQRQTPPLAILDLQSTDLSRLAADGHLDAYRHVCMSELVAGFNEALGSCERLKKTPFPTDHRHRETQSTALAEMEKRLGSLSGCRHGPGPDRRT